MEDNAIALRTYHDPEVRHNFAAGLGENACFLADLADPIFSAGSAMISSPVHFSHQFTADPQAEVTRYLDREKFELHGSLDLHVSSRFLPGVRILCLAIGGGS